MVPEIPIPVLGWGVVVLIGVQGLGLMVSDY